MSKTEADDLKKISMNFLKKRGLLRVFCSGTLVWTSNSYVKTKNGEEEVVAKEFLPVQDTFDLEVKNNEHKYYANGIVSHNTGKTSIGHILCNEAKNHTIIWITPEMITRFMNSIKEFYQLADFVSPCIVMLEDLDLFGVDRDMGGDIHRLGTLMNILDGVNSITNSITIATTNRLESIEKALRNRPGRFDRIIEIPHLDEELRKKMFTDRLKIWKIEETLIDYIVDKTDKWTGAQVQEFVNTINLNFITQGEGDGEITQEIVDKILETMYEFGVGEHSKAFGFRSVSKKDDEDNPMGFGKKRKDKNEDC